MELNQIFQIIPGVSNVVDTIDSGLKMAEGMAGKLAGGLTGDIGKSLINKIDYK